MGTEIATLRSLPEVVAEYEAKAKAIPEALAAFHAAGQTLKLAASLVTGRDAGSMGRWGGWG